MSPINRCPQRRLRLPLPFIDSTPASDLSIQSIHSTPIPPPTVHPIHVTTKPPTSIHRLFTTPPYHERQWDRTWSRRHTIPTNIIQRPKGKGTSHMKKLIVGSILALVLVSMARARAAKAPGMHSGPPWASSGGNHDNHTIHRSRFCNVRSVRSVRSFGTVGTSGQAAPQAAPQDATREYL